MNTRFRTANHLTVLALCGAEGENREHDRDRRARARPQQSPGSAKVTLLKHTINVSMNQVCMYIVDVVPRV